jgi:HK97 family phage prohead protease
MSVHPVKETLIEGYASLFGVRDLAGDVIRPGAFARSLAEPSLPPMLLQHVGGRPAGQWTRVREDGRGLFVRGLVSEALPAGAIALRRMASGALDGLSIGFVAREWSPRPGGGRDLRVIELKEISLVAAPMLPGARFQVLSPWGTNLIAA